MSLEARMSAAALWDGFITTSLHYLYLDPILVLSVICGHAFLHCDYRLCVIQIHSLIVLIIMALQKQAQTDWTKCVLCQEDNDEDLQNPSAGKKFKPEDSYKTLVDNIQTFNTLCEMPMDINIDRLDDGDGIVETFLRNKAVWHKRCKLEFNNTKLVRAQKRKNQTGDDINMTAKRIRREPQVNLTQVCFFCDEKGSDDLHDASTFTVDMKVRDCAMLLRDADLIRKLSGGDMIAQEAKYHTKCLVALHNR